MTAFDRLGTEARDAAGVDLDLRTTLELVELMNAADATVADAVAAAAPAVAALIDAVAGRLAAGGRLIYVGAGTSGRLAALDAVECEPTFSVPVTALVAPDDEAEDDRDGHPLRPCAQCRQRLARGLRLPDDQQNLPAHRAVAAT